jgi:hypothetical protein
MAMDEEFKASGHFRTPDLIMKIVSSRVAPTGPDADFFVHCAYVCVSKAVADATRQFSINGQPDDENQNQCAFPGFEKIHRAYQIDGETVLAEKMTVGQAMRVLDELRRVQRGTELHIHELQRFIDEVLIPRGNGN